jgi:hypothetical protein
MKYNSTREHMQMREYGRHIQEMVNYVCSIEDDQKRQQQAEVLIEIMAILNPQLKTVEEYRQKLWDHLFVMSDFALKIQSPYPIPEKETYKQKPDALPYPKRKPKYSHLGKNLELVIEKALAEQDPDKRLGFSNNIAYYMKLCYNNWHKENIHDESIRAELTAITKGELDFTQSGYVKYYRENATRDNRNNNNRNRNFRNGGGNSGNNNNRNNNRNNNNNGGSNNRNKFKKKRF